MVGRVSGPAAGSKDEERRGPGSSMRLVGVKPCETNRQWRCLGNERCKSIFAKCRLGGKNDSIEKDAP